MGNIWVSGALLVSWIVFQSNKTLGPWDLAISCEIFSQQLQLLIIWRVNIHNDYDSFILVGICFGKKFWRREAKQNIIFIITHLIVTCAYMSWNMDECRNNNTVVWEKFSVGYFCVKIVCGKIFFCLLGYPTIIF